MKDKNQLKKAGLFLVLALTLSGCGLSVVKKQELFNAAQDGLNRVTEARASVCGDQGNAALDSLEAALMALKLKFGN